MRTGLHAAKDHAERLLDPSKLGPLAKPRRPLSAAINYVLALDTMLAFPRHLVGASDTPESLRRGALEALASTAGTTLESAASEARQHLEHKYALGRS